MIATLAFATFFLGFLTLAAISDVADLRIPNRLTLAMAACGLPAVWLLGAGAAALPAAALTGVATLAVAWAMFHLGWLGGGDAKLAAAASLWLGPEAMLVFVLATALFGAMLAAGLLVLSRSEAALSNVGSRWRTRLTAEAISVPYAVAMAPAGAVAMLSRFADLS